MMNMEARTRMFAETDFTRKPVITLVAKPHTTVGRKRMDVAIGVRCWASWKL